MLLHKGGVPNSQTQSKILVNMLVRFQKLFVSVPVDPKTDNWPLLFRRLYVCVTPPWLFQFYQKLVARGRPLDASQLEQGIFLFQIVRVSGQDQFDNRVS